MPVTLSFSRTRWGKAKGKVASWVFYQHGSSVCTPMRNLSFRSPTPLATPWPCLVLSLVILLFYSFPEMESTQTVPTLMMMEGLRIAVTNSKGRASILWQSGPQSLPLRTQSRLWTCQYIGGVHFISSLSFTETCLSLTYMPFMSHSEDLTQNFHSRWSQLFFYLNFYKEDRASWL